MKKEMIVPIALALLLPAGPEGKGGKPQEPFYRRYLVAGNRLDDQILEQEHRVAADPNSADLRNDFGNLLAARRFPEQARLQYKKALELDRSHFLAAYNLGLLYETEGKTFKAIVAYRKSIARKRGFPHSRFRLGRLYEKCGWSRMAISEYAKALRLDPAMRDPKHNPLVVEARLLDRASLVNYPRDIARATMASDAVYMEAARFRAVPIDRSLSSQDLSFAPTPEPADVTASGAEPLPPQPPPIPPQEPGATASSPMVPPTPDPQAPPILFPVGPTPPPRPLTNP